MRYASKRDATALTRRSAIIAGSAGLIGAASRALAAEDDDLQRVLDGEGNSQHALAGIAGAAFARRSQAIRNVALGRARIDPDRPMSVDAAARVASISKHVTTIGLLQLVETNRIGLGDDASGHLGFLLRHPSFPDTPITVRMLLSHTSGIRNGPSYPVSFGRPLAAALKAGGLQYDHGGWWSPKDEPPGWFCYSDANFACIAQIIEQTSGQRFDRYMTDHVLSPLKLNSGFNWSGVSQITRDRAAALYRKGEDEAHFQPDGPWIPQLDQNPPAAPTILVVRSPEAANLPLENYRPGDNGFVFAPQGGLRASVRDLMTIARMLAGGGTLNGRRILKTETVALMQTPVWRFDPKTPNGEPYGGGGILAYGLGTCILTGSAGQKGDDLFPGCAGWVGHLGEAYGLLSGLWVNPKTGDAIAYIINGVSSGNEQNSGVRSAYTWQEERIAAGLVRSLSTH